MILCKKIFNPCAVFEDEFRTYILGVRIKD